MKNKYAVLAIVGTGSISPSTTPMSFNENGHLPSFTIVVFFYITG